MIEHYPCCCMQSISRLINRSTIDCFCILGVQKDSLKRKSKSFIIRDDALFFKDAKKGVELKVS